jgi:hypothetical protein
MEPLIAPAGMASGKFIMRTSARPASLAELGLRRAGEALLRWADDWHAWRLRRAAAELITLDGPSGGVLWRDIGLSEGLHDAARSRQALERLHWQAWR